MGSSELVNKQRNWLSLLQQIIPHRDILIQHHEKDTWHSWRECTHEKAIHTRSILANEIVFDPDTNDWEIVKKETQKIWNFCRENGIPYLAAWSGGKSIHTSIFFDPKMAIDEDIASDLKKYGIDVPMLLRKYLARYILENAGIDIEKAKIDRLKFSFSSTRKGSMLRIIGCKRENGAFKTYIDSTPNQKPKPSELPLKFPDKIDLWDLHPLKEEVIAFLRNEINEYQKHELKPVEGFKSSLEDVYCAKKILEGQPIGKRRPGAFNLVVFGKKCGLSIEEILAILKVYHFRCEISSKIPWQEIENKARDTYKRDYNPSCKAIKEIFGEEYCKKSECAISKAYKEQLDQQAEPSKELSKEELEKQIRELEDQYKPVITVEVDENYITTLIDTSIKVYYDVKDQRVKRKESEIKRASKDEPRYLLKVHRKASEKNEVFRLYSKIEPWKQEGKRNEFARKLMTYEIAKDRQEAGRLADKTFTKLAIEWTKYNEEWLKYQGPEEVRELDYKEIAEEIMQEHIFKTMIDTEEIYYYNNNGAYLPNGEAIIKKYCEAHYGEEITIHGINEVIGHIQRSTFVERREFERKKYKINLENGILDLRTNEPTLQPHSPDFLSIIEVPVKYNPNANCPNIKKFFSEVLNEKDIPTIEELFGYCLYQDHPIQKGFIFVGEGANGKSTLINLLKTFLGKENCASISLHELETNRFAVSNLYGKLANLYPDLPSRDLTGTAKFKMLTGGDLIGAEKKFKDHFTYENYAKLVFSANRIPPAWDDTLAFYRRWIIINFPNVFTGEKADKKLLEKLTADEELSGLLNLAIKGLNRLLNNGDFSNAPGIEQTREIYIRMSDSVAAFNLDLVEVSPNDWIEKKKLYNIYCQYCKEMNYPSVSESVFHKRMVKIVQIEDYKPRRGKKRITAWQGIKIKGKNEEKQDLQGALLNSSEGEYGQGGQGFSSSLTYSLLIMEKMKAYADKWQKENGVVNSLNLIEFLTDFLMEYQNILPHDAKEIASEVFGITPDMGGNQA